MQGNNIIAGNNYVLEFLLNKKFRIYRHLVLILFFTVLLFTDARGDNSQFSDICMRMLIAICFILLLYMNMYLLVPVFLFKDRYIAYFLLTLLTACVGYMLLIGVVTLFHPVNIRPDGDNDKPFHHLRFIFIFCAFIAASTAVKLFQRLIKDSQRINELERITAHSELEQLKNQINPHFLFNMLNNANVLTKKDPEKASQVLMKLSDLLRYQLYDSNRARVLLTADISFLTDFLNLEKIRRDNFEFIVSKEGMLSGVQIPPLLFITFVENAVKYSLDAEKESYVHIYFSIQDDELKFICINSKPKVPANKRSAGGLGLVNVKRRLELLYPSGHTLYIKDEADFYHTTLTIKI